MTSGTKNPKKLFFLHFKPIDRVWILSSGVENTHLRQLFLYSIYLFEYIFSKIVRIDKLHDYHEKIVFLTMVAMETGKRHFFSYH